MGVGKVQGAGAGWMVGKVRSPECRVRRAEWWVKGQAHKKCRLGFMS